MSANFGKEKAIDYMQKMRSAVGTHLIDPESIYYGREGHLRLAREFGYGLNDFNEDGKQEILHGSYSVVYVTGCYLKPILNAKEWIEEMRKQII